MPAALRCALIIVCAIAFGNLHEIGRVAAQEEGPAGACAKGTDQSNATLATAYMNAFAVAEDKVFDEILSVDYMHHFGIGKDASKIAESWNESGHLGRLQAAGVLTSDKLSTPSR
ncbi:MAG: hypothetical protein K0R27_3459 [Xanthobacteraceae bacterium]|jgi:hypothetical protein|nr:hypothetical protein [Xanthobacteraceae bacterium]